MAQDALAIKTAWRAAVNPQAGDLVFESEHHSRIMEIAKADGDISPTELAAASEILDEAKAYQAAAEEGIATVLGVDLATARSVMSLQTFDAESYKVRIGGLLDARKLTGAARTAAAAELANHVAYRGVFITHVQAAGAISIALNEELVALQRERAAIAGMEQEQARYDEIRTGIVDKHWPRMKSLLGEFHTSDSDVSKMLALMSNVEAEEFAVARQAETKNYSGGAYTEMLRKMDGDELDDFVEQFIEHDRSEELVIMFIRALDHPHANADGVRLAAHIRGNMDLNNQQVLKETAAEFTRRPKLEDLLAR